MANNVERLIRIYNRLRRGPVTIEIISAWAKAADINISTRQLYRDLNNLQSLKIAEGENVVEFIDEKNHKTWKLEYDDSNDLINQFDINSFMLFKNFVPTSISNFRNDSLEKFEKILYRSLSKNKYQHNTEANEMYLKKTDWYDNLYGKNEHSQLEDIIWALQNKRVLQVTASDINPSNINIKDFNFPFTIYPMELLFHRGRVHIAGLEIKTEKLLICTVDKSLTLNLTNDVFSRKKYMKYYNEQMSYRFGISEPLSEKVYNIQLEFSTDYALSMKNFHWHKTAAWKELKNGNYMLEIKCCMNRELIGFVAQGLDKVKVHKPKILKDILLNKYKETIKVNLSSIQIEQRPNHGYYSF